MLERVKQALRITSNTFDAELTGLISSAQLDLGIAGVTLPSTLDEVCITAVITYCKMRFGNPENYDKLKAAYDEMKAQLSMATGYTGWGHADE
jgi:hypothetical protein